MMACRACYLTPAKSNRLLLIEIDAGRGSNSVLRKLLLPDVRIEPMWGSNETGNMTYELCFSMDCDTEGPSCATKVRTKVQ